MWNGIISASYSISVSQYNSAGTYNFTVPAGVYCIRVEAWGGGGAGGGATSQSRSTGGGGAGGTYTNQFVSVTPGQVIPVTVGAGGTGVSAGNGNPGGTSSFGALVTAVGGGGGSVNSGSNPLNGAGAPAATGITHNGGAGGTGDATTSNSGTSGGGGGGAGATGNGGNASVGTAGVGGTGGGGDGASGTGTSGNGPAATELSGGGGGGRNSGSGATSRTGGAGYKGQVILTLVNTSDFLISTSNCIAGSALITVTSSSLANGSYSVIYNTTNPTNTGINANINFSSGTGTFSTPVLTGPVSDLVVTGIELAGSNCISSINTNNTLHINIIPTAAISYPGPFCFNDATVRSVTLTGQGGGSYTAPSGLSIDASNGDIRPSLSTAGTYTVTYSFSDGTCSNSTTTSVTIGSMPDATFSYKYPSYCQSGKADLDPIFGSGAVAGSFTADSPDLIFDATVPGKLNPALSKPGIYTVTNTVTAGGCTTSASATVEIISAPFVNISYSTPNVCNTVTTLLNVTRTFVPPTTDAFGHYDATPVGLSINTTPDHNGNVFNPSAGQIDPFNSLPGVYTVTYSFGDGVCNNTATTTVTIYALPSFTTQPSLTPAVYCDNGPANAITVNVNPGVTSGVTATISNYEWFRSETATNSGGTSMQSGATLSSYTPATTGLGPLPITYYYYCVVTNGNGCTATSNVSGPVTVNPTIANNIIYGDNSICSSDTPLQLPVELPTGGSGTYDYTWQSSIDAGTSWQNANGTIVGESFVPSMLSQTTMFQRTVSSGGCISVSNSILIDVRTAAVIYNVAGTATVCSGASADISLSGNEAAIVYQLKNSLDDSNVGNSVTGDGTANPVVLSTGPLTTTITVYVSAYKGATDCSTRMSGTAVINVLAEVSNILTTTSQTACSGSAPDDITGSVPTGGNGTYLYSWKMSTDGGTTWPSASGVNDGQNYSPSVLTVETWYQRWVTSGPCLSGSNIIKVTINTPPAPVNVTGPDGGQFCGSTKLTALNGGDGTIYYQGSQSGGTRLDLGGSPQTVSTTGTYYFRALNSSGCWGQEGSVTVTASAPPSALGTTICQGSTGALISASTCPPPTTGTSRYPLTGLDNPGVGTIGWTNPENITTSGAPYAVASMPNNGSITHYLTATNFGFNIPSGALIKGLSVTINRSSSDVSTPYIRDNAVRIIRGGVVDGIDRAKTTTDWPTSLGTATYGGATDTWGLTGLSYSDINSNNFGVALSAINSKCQFLSCIYNSNKQ